MSNVAINQFKDKSNKSIEHLKSELSNLKAGKANPSILSKVNVDYYGVPTPITQLASVQTPESRMLQVTPYDVNIISEVEKAIMLADLGLNPSNDGKNIRLVIPQLTEETRKELVKKIKKIAEDTKVSVRNERRDAMDMLKKQKKDNELTEDDLKKFEEEVQKLTDDCIKDIDNIYKEKEKEVLSI